jgi:NADH-quinone oxidoreductase subunit C
VSDEAVVSPAPAEQLYGCVVTYSRGEKVIHASRENYIATLKKAIDDSFTMCTDLTAVDFLTYASTNRQLPSGVSGERFEIVLNLISLERRERLRLRVQIAEAEASLPTAFDLFPGTEAMEREVFDMFGIEFEGHPDPSRILMPEDWEGHPLRKDFSVGRIPVQFKGAPS